MEREQFVRSAAFWRQMRRAVWVGAATGAFALVFLGIIYSIEDLILGDEHPTDLFDGPVFLIGLLGLGGLIVGLMRRRFAQPPAGTSVFDELSHGRVEPKEVPTVVATSAVSLASGAPLGPEAALGSLGGGLGTWDAERDPEADEERTAVATQAGVGGAFGALVSPFISALMALELEGRPDARLAALLPTVTAAVAGFLVFYPIAGELFFGLFEVPTFTLEDWHLLAAVGIGLAGAVLAIIVGVSMKASVALMARPLERHPLLVPTVIGALVGAIIFAVPLAGFSGTKELETVISDGEKLALGILLASIAAKIVATSLVFGSGFIGGPIFPMLFIGGTAGVALSEIVTGLPPAVAISAMMVAVPAPLMGLPISAVFLVTFSLSLGAQQAIPAGIAALTSLVVVSWFMEVVDERRGGNP